VGFFHPTATCRICLPGGFPASQPTRLVVESFLPSCRLVDVLLQPAS
jgi:hypothetical protein